MSSRSAYAAFRSPRTFAGADPSEGRGLGSTAKTIALFALIALPVGLLLSRSQTRQQTQAEKAAFRRTGLDWENRFQYPK